MTVTLEKDNDWRAADVAPLLDNGTGTIPDTLVVIPTHTTDPAAPVEGEMIINSTQNVAKLFMGGVWIVFASTLTEGVLVDPVGVTDTVTIHSDNSRQTFTEQVGLTDTVEVVKDAAATPTDAVGVTDSVVVAKVITVTVTETVGVTDDTTEVLA